jgi:lia operon protein LiaG
MRTLSSTVVALLAALPSLAAAQQTKTLTLQGQDVAVYDLVGELTVERGSGSAVQVEVRPGGKDAGKLTVESTQIKGRPAIRVNFPDDHIVYPAMGRHSNSNFSIDDDGTWDSKGNHSRRITVRGDGNGLEAHADITVRVPDGQRIALFLGVGKIEASNVNGDISLDAASGDIRMTSVGGQLHVDTGSGNVEATTATGTLNIDTGSGDVRVTTFKGTALDIETGSGNVDGNQIESPRLDIETGSGNITVAGTKSTDLELSAGSGDVEVTLETDVNSLDAETGSGNVTLRIPEAAGAELSLETGSGDFQVDFPVQLIRKEEGKLIAKMGDGQGRIDIETGSGDVTLKR